MLELVICTNRKFGIGNRNSLPWKVKDDLSLFRTLTMDSIIIIGSKTFLAVPKNSFSNRQVIVLSKTPKENQTNDVKQCSSLEEALQSAYNSALENRKKIFVAGGAQVYTQILKNYRHLISCIHVSLLSEQYNNVCCDVFLDENWLEGFHASSTQSFPDFQYTIFKNPLLQDEFQYINLLKEVYFHGDRTYGRNGNVQRVFSKNLKFDLRNGFPLLTTKKMFFRGIVEELIFFLKGETNSKVLEEKGINIWKGNTNRDFLDKHGFTEYPEGEMGPMYGYQWRNFGAPFHMNGLDSDTQQGIDQLAQVIKEIKIDPHSRRLLMTDYNPSQAKEGVLYPCHSIVLQFFVEDGCLDVFCFNRSADLFLGLPFNIASSSLLLLIIANLTGLKPRFLNLSLGDCHIYEQHLPKVLEQISRVPFKAPKIELKKQLDKVEDILFEDFELTEYQHHPSIKSEMIA